MTSWSLEALLADLHSSVTEQLARARRTIGHPVATGDVAESVWAQLLAPAISRSATKSQKRSSATAKAASATSSTSWCTTGNIHR